MIDRVAPEVILAKRRRYAKVIEETGSTDLNVIWAEIDRQFYADTDPVLLKPLLEHYRSAYYASQPAAELVDASHPAYALVANSLKAYNATFPDRSLAMPRYVAVSQQIGTAYLPYSDMLVVQTRLLEELPEEAPVIMFHELGHKAQAEYDGDVSIRYERLRHIAEQVPDLGKRCDLGLSIPEFHLAFPEHSYDWIETRPYVPAWLKEVFKGYGKSLDRAMQPERAASLDAKIANAPACQDALRQIADTKPEVMQRLKEYGMVKIRQKERDADIVALQVAGDPAVAEAWDALFTPQMRKIAKTSSDHPTFQERIQLTGCDLSDSEGVTCPSLPRMMSENQIARR